MREHENFNNQEETKDVLLNTEPPKEFKTGLEVSADVNLSSMNQTATTQAGTNLKTVKSGSPLKKLKKAAAAAVVSKIKSKPRDSLIDPIPEPSPLQKPPA